jgi:hypothetical protein
MNMSKSNNISTNRTAIGDMAILRDDELDAITGGADVKAESTTFGALSVAISQVINSYAEPMTTAATTKQQMTKAFPQSSA